MDWFAKALSDLLEDSNQVSDQTRRDVIRVCRELTERIDYLPRHKSFDALTHCIEDAETLDQIAGIFAGMPREFGLEHATLAVVAEGRDRILKHRVLSSLPKVWWQTYKEEALYKHDPIIEVLGTQGGMIFLDDLALRDPAPNRYLKAAQKHDIGEHGVAFRIDFPSGFVGVCVLGCHGPATKVRQIWDWYADDLRHLTEQFCQSLIFFGSVESLEHYELSADEVRFLRIIVQSEDPTAALRMNFRFGSPKTIQSSILRKMGVKSIFQAVIIALRRGDLDGRGFDTDEIVSHRTSLTGWDIVQNVETDVQMDTSSR